MSTVDIALSLAAAGWHVFPCSAAGKPFVRWGEEATTDPATIKNWFTGQSDRIGVHCGRSGLLVVDRDNKDGRDGFASLEQSSRPLPKTFRYTSRSGLGRHDVYAAPAGVDCTIASDVLGMQGVDIRAGVGMVVYNGPALAKAPSLAPAPAWAVVHHKETAYSSTVSLEEWLAEERSTEPSAKARRLAEAMPLEGVSNADLLTLVTPLVDGLMWGNGRRQACDLARERYTRNYPEAVEAFDRAWVQAIARVDADWEAGVLTPPTEYEPTNPTNEPRLRLLTRSDLRAIPKPDWWVADLVAQSTICVIAGPHTVGKTFALTDLMAHIATGTDWQGYKVRQGKVLYIPGEGVDFFEDRLVAWEQHYGIAITEDQLQFASAEEFNLSDEDAVSKLRVNVAVDRLDLVCIDTLSQLSNLENENDNAQMAAIVRAARSIREARPRCTVVIVHHTNKSENAAVRGAGALSNNVDTVIMLRREAGENRGMFGLSTEGPHGKQKNTRALKLDHFRLTESGPSAVVTRQLTHDPYRATIMSVLAEGEWHGAGAFEDAFSDPSGEWSRKRYRTAIDKLIETDVVEETGTTRNRQYRKSVT